MSALEVVTHFADHSNHDWARGGMDFDAMRVDGIRGSWHKSSDGLRYYRDRFWPVAIPRMKKAFTDGVYGAYHVLWGDRDIRQQMLWWFEVLDATAPGWRTDPRFVLVADCEPFGYNQAPSIGQVNSLGDMVAAEVGKTLGAYCVPWHYKAALRELRYPLISSNYGSNPAVHYRAAYPGDGSTRWLALPDVTAPILQYGSRTRMGDQGTCDADAALMPVDDLVRLFSPGWRPTTTQRRKARKDNDVITRNLKPGESYAWTPQTVYGGQGGLYLGAIFGDVQASIAAYDTHQNDGRGGWTYGGTEIEPKVITDGAPSGEALRVTDSNIRMISVTNQGGGTLVVDFFPVEPYTG